MRHPVVFDGGRFHGVDPRFGDGGGDANGKAGSPCYHAVGRPQVIGYWV